jgi:hypothetical protein
MLSMVGLAFRFTGVRLEISFWVEDFFAAVFLFLGTGRFLAARRRVLVFINSDSAGKDVRAAIHRPGQLSLVVAKAGGETRARR